jgi:hypothetical protein
MKFLPTDSGETTNAAMAGRRNWPIRPGFCAAFHPPWRKSLVRPGFLNKNVVIQGLYY